jgi:cell division protease FtsH
VTVDRPTWQGRLAILKVHTRNKPLADDVDLERVARGMIGMSGADLRNLCNEAALEAGRANRNIITQRDFDAAGDRVRLGLRRDDTLTDEEKRRTAYHEAGHALCALLEPKAHPLDRVSIVPRGRTGGVTLFRPDEDRMDRSYSEFMADLVVGLGGRAADRLAFGEPMSGAIGDIQQVTRLARRMVTQFGMSDRLGPVYYRQGEEHVFLGKEIQEGRDFSEGTARIIDEEIQKIVTDALARSEKLLADNRASLDLIAAALLAHEELDQEEIGKLLKGVPIAELRKPSPAPPAPVPDAVTDPSPTPAVNPRPGIAFGGA